VTLTASPPTVIAGQDPQALFKEARRRRRRRWLTAAGTALALAGIVVILNITMTGPTHGRSTKTKLAPTAVAAGPFTGTWHVKYYFVHIV